MRDRIRAVVALVFGLWLAACGGGAQIPVMNGPAPTEGARELGALVNAERSARGIPILATDPALDAAAQDHAEDMAANGYFSHQGRDGSSALQRMRRAGHYACYAAENIAQGQRDAEATVSSWMKSEGHRRNVLSPSPKSYGSGVAGGPTWVMIYAREC